jgi:hypothetical protein
VYPSREGAAKEYGVRRSNDGVKYPIIEAIFFDQGNEKVFVDSDNGTSFM